MKAGQVFRTAKGDVYVVVGDYGKLRPLYLDGLEMNAAHAACPHHSTASELGSFYKGDTLLTSSLSDYMNGIVADTVENTFWF